ncbi:MAG: CDP-alcohol phosphatidyltransferase family protein [Actinobacteria bacterium]|nr:CDP-alcohol phosphatidyltransferase family protein [Actinomycetota bacterium]MCB9388664.1 CDP-alcohol phosphatidyltransferase family protein [Acidimicrobiia bacterium]
MLDRRARSTLEKTLRPIGRTLHKAHIRPNHVTVAGVVASAFAAIAIARGQFVLGAALVAANGLLDVLDGAVAKANNAATPRGAFFDSVMDRIADAVVLGGVGWYLSAQDPRLGTLALAAVALTMLISYERARAESLGYDARGGLMERAERTVMLIVMVAFGWLEPMLWIWVVLGAVTTIQRFVVVWRQGDYAPNPAPSPLLRGGSTNGASSVTPASGSAQVSSTGQDASSVVSGAQTSPGDVTAGAADLDAARNSAGSDTIPGLRGVKSHVAVAPPVGTMLSEEADEDAPSTVIEVARTRWGARRPRNSGAQQRRAAGTWRQRAQARKDRQRSSSR